jgi:uncharacterized repeat protein (TIGR03847 family)
MAAYFEFGDVDTFTVGALGQPGQRIFFLQARVDGRRVVIKCEKQQAGALAQYLQRLLTDLPSPLDMPLPASLEPAMPIEPVFVLGPIGLAFDRELDRFVVVLEEVVTTDEAGEPIGDEDDRGKVRLRLTRAQAMAFGSRAEEVIAAGRPSCMFCGQPMDPDGHPCPRMN